MGAIFAVSFGPPNLFLLKSFDFALQQLKLGRLAWQHSCGCLVTLKMGAEHSLKHSFVWLEDLF